MSNSKQKQKPTISGKRLQERYTAIGLSQTGFARAVKRTQPAVSQWVHDKVRVPEAAVERLRELEAKAAARGEKTERPKAAKPGKNGKVAAKAVAVKGKPAKKLSALARKREELKGRKPKAKKPPAPAVAPPAPASPATEAP